MENDEIAEINDFIRRLHNGWFEFTPLANKLKVMCDVKPDDSQSEIEAKAKTLAISLDENLSDFQECSDPDLKLKLARKCKSNLQKMWVGGCIREGHGSARKLEQYKEENEQLKRELAVVSSNLNRKIRQIQAIEKHFNLKSEDDFREGGT